MGDLAFELTQLHTDYPIALLPVRLETRFVASPPALKIRIYPDEIVADGHRRALTTGEWVDATQYWRDGWDPADEYQAWQTLTSRYPAERAAWLVAQATPTNVKARPGGAPSFAPPALKDDLLPEVTAKALPRSWLVIAYRGGLEVGRVTSGEIVEPVHLSFAPTVAAGDPSLVARDGVTIEPELLWTIDYDQAVAIGMAVTLPLTSADLALGFDRVVVVGVRTQVDAAAGGRARDRAARRPPLHPRRGAGATGDADQQHHGRAVGVPVAGGHPRTVHAGAWWRRGGRCDRRRLDRDRVGGARHDPRARRRPPPP
jgi:hypothetical protein